MRITKIFKQILQPRFTSKLLFFIGSFLLNLIVFNKILSSSTALLTSTLISLIICLNLKTAPPLKQKNKKTKERAWPLSLSLLVGLFFVNHILEKFNFVLNDFGYRTMGAAVLEGVSISNRSLLYVALIILFIATFSLSFYVYSRIDTLIHQTLNSKETKEQEKMMLSSSLASIFLLIYHYLNGATIYVNIFDFLIFLTLITYLIFVGKAYFKKRNKMFFDLLNNYDLTILSLLFPFVVFFIRWVLVNGSFFFSYSYFLFFIFLWILFWPISYSIAKVFSKVKRQVVIRSILLAAIPFLLIPIFIPISNEIQFSLSTVSKITAKLLAVLSILISFTVSFYLFIKSINSKKDISSQKFAHNYYFPILIASVVMFNQFSNFIEIPGNLDMFHQGENLIAIQQLFSFGSIPFIKIYPTHGFSYMISQFLYSIVNGYVAFEPWLWEWMTKIFEISLLYFVLKKITGSFFATIAILFLPLIGILGGGSFTYGHNPNLALTYYLSSFAAALSITSLLKKPNFSRAVIHWGVCTLLLIWRIDFGIACFVSSFFILPVFFINKEKNRNKVFFRFKELMRALCFIGLLSLSLGVFLSFKSGESFIKILAQIFNFITIQAQAQGLTKMVSTSSALNIFQYAILPLIGIFYVLFFIVSFLKKKLKDFEQYQYLLLFIAIFSLIISTRSVQRQSLAIMGYNSYLFAFLGINIPFYIKTVKKEIAGSIFLILLFLYQLVLPNGKLLLIEKRLVNLRTWRDKESRVRINDQQYKKLTEFLNKNLKEDQTFLDMSSSPMFYVTTNKKFVNYFIPNAYQTSEPVQKFSLEKIKTAYTDNQIPIVIFRQAVDAANNIDGVPNETRSYRLYEFIYKNYKPLGYVDGYMIWSVNNYVLPEPDNLKLIKTFNQEFNLGKIPYIWGTFDQYGVRENTKILLNLIEKPESEASSEPRELIIKKELDKTSGNYIDLKIKTTTPNTLTIQYGESIISFDLVPSDESVNYLIRISSQYSWMRQDIEEVKFSPSGDIKIESAVIRKGD